MSAYCTHGIQKQSCRLCNTKHPNHGLSEHHFLSMFEQAGINSLKQHLGNTALIKQQSRIDHNNRYYKLDAIVQDCIATYAFEFDGMQHYYWKNWDKWVKLKGKRMEDQFNRDREIEDFCLQHKITLIRIPQNMQRHMNEAVLYGIMAARQDKIDNTPRIHYIKYLKTYAKVNEIASVNMDISFINAKPHGGGKLCPFTRS